MKPMHVMIHRIGALVLMLVGSTIAVPFWSAAAEGRGSNDPPATHNMLIVGDGTIFLSHLPMFGAHSPHRYQVILQASVSKDGKNLDEVYANDRKSHPETKMYTLNPTTEFVLPALFTGDPPASHAFRATVFRGHFERGGKPVDGLANVDVDVKKVVHAEQFDPKNPRAADLTYILFGKGQQLFLAHLIQRPPDFDQILSVKVSGHDFTDEELNRGVRVAILKRKNAAAQRLTPKEKVVGQGHVTGAHQFLPLQIEPAVEWYFEQGELRMPADFDQTKEEKKAGF